MRRLWFLCTMLALACGPTPAPQPPTPPPPVNWWVDVIACRQLNPCVPVEGASVKIHITSGYTDPQLTNSDGYTVWEVPSTLVDSDVVIAADGYEPFADHLDVLHSHDGQRHNEFLLTATHVDPSTVPLAQLAAIQGAMWPHADIPGVPYGPRPGDPSNIISTGAWNCYTPAQRDAIATELHRRHYTHVVFGPFGGGYHGQFCDGYTDWSVFLDDVQDLWDRGFMPIVFIHNDNTSFEQTRDSYTPLLTTPRAQRLLRIVVPSGWEPTRYGWSSCTWALFVSWARQTLPNAMVLIHTVNDVDAPVGTDERCDDNGRPNGEGWTRVVAAGLHGWLIQNGPYDVAPSANPSLAREFAAQFQPDGDGATFHSIGWHFTHGIGGFPTTSVWGNTPIKLYSGEVTAYTGYWNNLPESVKEQWGDLCMQQPMCAGYLDSGTKPVPVR